ncbi:hypothetical protein CAPTEDRAFT_171523 [Capitella teleta]|uniref:ER membrane protein complex subunit 1 n=1 Tax=Capitella teleta TaxID=283909 RepID=R7UJT6_CAPTE|nr:hypothetical protein CAPTEDRAFT_171523 [Capitella teleta]|eukprot:ELU06819.1 hypothetical protein CAPTEDRAFT_171523 [Capitella teleta]
MKVQHNPWIFLLSVAFLVQLCLALYEDQAGKFDWRHQYIGRAVHATFDQSGVQGKRLLLSTEQNVVAAVNARNGQLGWRHILEEGDSGRIDDMIVVNNFVLVLCSGGGLVRAFHSISGSLQWEAPVPASPAQKRGDLALHGGDDQLLVLSGDSITVLNSDTGVEVWTKVLSNTGTTDYVYTASHGNDIIVAGISPGSHVSKVIYTKKGEVKLQESFPAAWLASQEQCQFSKGHLICLSQDGSIVYHARLDSNAASFIASSISQYGLQRCQQLEVFSADTELYEGMPIFSVRCDTKSFNLFIIKANTKLELLKTLKEVDSAEIIQFEDITVLVTISREDGDKATMAGIDLETGKEMTELSVKVHFPQHHGAPNQLRGVLFKHKDGLIGMRILVISEDHSLVLYQQSGKVLWLREEALASIMSVEMVDLPVSQIMAKMEDEFGNQNNDLLSMFVRRFTTQFQQVQAFILQLRQRLKAVRHHHHHHQVEEAEVEQDEEEEEEDEEEYLTRDDFNLHKMIVAVTSCGKIFGLDSQNGHVVWRLYNPLLVPFTKQGRSVLPLYVHRTTAHFPHQPQCSILGLHKTTRKGLLFTFHPISGVAEENMPASGFELNHGILQATLLTQMDSEFLRPLVVLSTDLKYFVYPREDTDLVKELAPSLYMFSSNDAAGILQGYNTVPTDQGLVADVMWRLDLKREGHAITQVVPKRLDERVNSQGIVLGDRSVMYKYLNPNLVVVIAEGDDGQGKNSFNVYLVDGVSGRLVFHCNHKKSSGPINVVHSENWVVYNFWNQKHRRVELAILEMYEGKEQSNTTDFSSLHPPPPPVIMRQAYTFPGHISAMAATITEIGITSKHILIAMQNGGILELAKAFLDPRRPENPTAESREEGLLPYIPELPRPFEATINYNHSVYNIRGIHTVASGLESTCLVLAYGLDLFYDRVMPSRMFDVLKDDFDYFFIGSVVVGMILVSLLTQKLAARKALNRAWK